VIEGVVDRQLERCSFTDAEGWTEPGIRRHDTDTRLFVSAADHCSQIVHAFDRRLALEPCPTRSFAGRVVDGHGRGVAGATVRVGTLPTLGWATSDETGRFAVVLDDDTTSVGVEAQKLGYGRSWTSALVLDVELEVALLPESSIAGVVVDGAGVPIAGALVETERGITAILDGRFQPDQTWTDAAGRFELRGLGAGHYSVHTDGRTGRSPSVAVELRPAELRDGLRLVATRGNVLEVTLRGPEGQPCPRGRVWLVSGSRPGIPEPDGRWVFADLARGRHHVGGRCEGALLVIDDVKVEGDSQLELRGARGASITGFVRDRAGNPVRAFVHAVGPNNHEGTRSEVDGSFALRGLPADRVRLDVTRPGVLPEARPYFDVAGNDQRTGVELIANEGACLTGHVHGLAERVAVKLDVGRDTIDLARPDASGAWRACGIGPGQAVTVKLVSATDEPLVFEVDGTTRTELAVRAAQVRSGEPIELRLDATNEHTIRGKVLRAGAPEAGAFVTLLYAWPNYRCLRPSGSASRRRLSDDAGQFEFAGLWSGDYVAYIELPTGEHRCVRLEAGAKNGAKTGAEVAVDFAVPERR
jgi:protocatechuate 3,4-dioxygenase beta subunit